MSIKTLNRDHLSHGVIDIGIENLIIWFLSIVVSFNLRRIWRIKYWLLLTFILTAGCGNVETIADDDRKYITECQWRQHVGFEPANHSLTGIRLYPILPRHFMNVFISQAWDLSTNRSEITFPEIMIFQCQLYWN